jgi:hypothetical protein
MHQIEGFNRRAIVNCCDDVTNDMEQLLHAAIPLQQNIALDQKI